MPGLHVQEPPVVIVDKPSWIFAQSCTIWSADPDDQAEILLVYKSPLVKTTGELYSPVADRLLRSEQLTTLYAGQNKSEFMMFGKADATIHYLAQAGHRIGFSMEVLTNHITDAVSRNGDLVP